MNKNLCKKGQFQSPININTKITKKCGISCNLEFFYQNSSCKIKNVKKKIIIEYDTGSYITFNSQVYELDKFSFTVPGSHKIDRYSYPVEIQIYHKSPGTDKILIISVLVDVDKKESKSMKFFNTFIPFIPRKSNREKTINMRNNWNISRMLPSDKAFYTYEGSLLFSPCKENVTWIIMDNSVNMNNNCYNILKSTIKKNTTASVF